jgi:acyl carrier protein
MNEVFEKIVDIIVDIADIPRDEVKEDSELMDDLNLSSLEIMAIVSKIEKEFSVKFNEKDLLAMSSLADMIDYLSNN